MALDVTSSANHAILHHGEAHRKSTAEGDKQILEATSLPAVQFQNKGINVFPSCQVLDIDEHQSFRICVQRCRFLRVSKLVGISF